MTDTISQTFEDNLANVFYYQNLNLLKSVSDKYKIDLSDLLNNFLHSAQEIKNNINKISINKKTTINTAKCNKHENVKESTLQNDKMTKKKFKIIEHDEVEYYWDLVDGTVYYRGNINKIAGKVNNLGELMLYNI